MLFNNLEFRRNHPQVDFVLSPGHKVLAELGGGGSALPRTLIHKVVTFIYA